MSKQTSEHAEIERLMKRLQIGTTNYNAANDLHAECYGTIGRMAGELERLRARVEELTACSRAWEDACFKAEAERDAERAKVAALRKDAAMLDWLDRHAWIAVAPDGITIAFERGSFMGFNPTVRGVVDAAMREQAMQALVDQAQQLGMGYGERK